MITLEDGKKIIEFLKDINYSHDAALKAYPLSQLFYQSMMIPESSFQSIDRFSEFLKKGILARDNGKIYATIRIVPFNNFYFIADSPFVASTSTTERYFSNKENKYGYIGDDGMMLANYILPCLSGNFRKKGLDLCAGSGIVGIALSPLFDYMHAVDIDESAFKWAKLNAQLNNIRNYTPYVGDLYEPVKALGPFDAIFANPSYSFFPPEIMKKYQVKKHEVADEFGLELVLRVIEGFKEYLASDGSGYICTFVPTLNGKDYLMQKIMERFSRDDYAFEIYYNFCYMHHEFKDYYNSLGITKFSFVFIKIRKGLPFQIKKVIPKSYYLSQIPIRKSLSNVKQQLKRILKGD